MKPHRRLFPTLAAALAVVAGTAGAAVDFEKDIRPVLRERCVECHGPKKQKASLRLDSRAFAFKGGEDGAVIVPGKSAESKIIARVTSTDPDEVMPSKGERLTAPQIAALREWIDAGALWPETGADRDGRLDHWAWQPVQRPRVPESAKRKAENENPIDAFVDAKLAEKGLARSPEDDARTLCRRLYFDLLGLPPTPEEAEAFVDESHRSNESHEAYERLVEKLLASPHYGERWARHWLDIAHYADTHGFERDQRRDNAWRYRDWVIRALNADMPYDEFLRAQIAGDALHPDDPASVIATGFLAAGPWDFVGQAETPSPVLKRLARADDLDDMVTQVMTAACGVTVNCARCHDHKLDPISQREYYALTAVFAGVKRGERDVDAGESHRLAEEKARLQREIVATKAQLARLENRGLDLADIVGGGDGNGSGKKGAGLNVETGQRQDSALSRLTPKANVFVAVEGDFVDGVVSPNGDGGAEVPVSTTGLKVRGVPKTSGEAWDAIRNGPINPQGTTKIGDLDFAADGHTLLGLHANAAITFDLAPMRAALKTGALRFRASVGYGGRPEAETNADVRVFVDAEPAFVAERIGPKTGPLLVQLLLPETARFLTLMSTDGADGNIGFDQIFYGDPRISAASPAALTAEEKSALEKLRAQLAELERQLKSQPEPAKVYGITTEPPPVVRVQHRGNPEDAREEVAPGALACVAGLSAPFGSELTDAQRRSALAQWITSPANPLTRRVLVNRLWHHHFGTGLVDTPSDFGLGGGRPTHPELLDWLAEEFAARGWSLKAMHRLICTSATYRQKSEIRNPSRAERDSLPEAARRGAAEAASKSEIDSSNRLLWRMNPRRLDAESLRDAVLAVSGKLNPGMFGPGYRDFDYEEAYAPVYKYITPDQPELWRRSVYRFAVRTTTPQFLTTLDCPNPANLTPARNVTTTALQSLALLNNDFMQKQAGYFAERAQSDPAPIERAFALVFGRKPSAAEVDTAAALVKSSGLTQLCRMLLNANEFVYVD